MASQRNRDLEAKLLKLFQDERLRSKDDVTRLFCNHLGFTYAGIPLPSRSEEFWGQGEVAELVERESFEILAQAGEARLGGFAIVYGTLRDFNLSNQRAIILQLRKSFRDALYVFSKPQTLDRATGAELHIIHAKVRAADTDGADGSRLILRRFRFGPGERYRTTAERLAKLDLNVQKSHSATAITALCNEAFDKEALTAEFFKKLDQHIKAIELDLRENQHLDGPEAFSEAQLLIERLIFLYFAQNRGWLNQSPTYLLDNFDRYRKDSEGFGYYHEFLHLLFHTLAEQTFGNRLEGVPFLNGGLFNDDEFKLPSSKLRIRNETFANLFDNLLEAYNFTVREDTPLSQEVAVDPEMLGKVFESIVLHAESAGEEYQAPDKRKATGSYYTPRIVVHFICRESLRLYFAQRAELLADPGQSGTWNQRVSRLFKEVDSTDGFSEEEVKILKAILSPSEAKRCLACLRAMRTLDPAVGSGAFPVGLLHELISLQRVFETVEKGYQDPVKGSGTQWMQKAKESFIERSLFGVDIQQQAIEICRLRLWLSLLVDYELGVNPFEAERSAFIGAINRISQLPNLEMNFKRGDSLHDFICDHPVRIEPQKPSQYAAGLERIEKLGGDLHKAKTGGRKRKLRLEILGKRIALAQKIVEDEIKALSDQSFNLGADWFGGGLSDSETRRRLDAEIERLQTALKQLERDQVNLRKLEQRPFDKDFYRKLSKLEGSEMDGPINFAWRIDFPHVLSGAPNDTLCGEFALVNQAQRQQELTASDIKTAPQRRPAPKSDAGFDLIVGNPPFVTARNPVKRELYRERWPRVCEGTYLLVSPFFELSFDLLKGSGQLGFIVSNAFAKREFGRPLVEDFFRTVSLQKMIDCSGLMFPGHGTPTCLVFGANDAPDKNKPIRVTAILPGGGDLRTPPEESALWAAISEHHDRSGYHDRRIAVYDWAPDRLLTWPTNFDLGADDLRRLLEANVTQRFDEFLVGTIGRVCFTGADELFFIDEHLLRRIGLTNHGIARFAVGDLFRNWSHAETHCLCPYTVDGTLLPKSQAPLIREHLCPWKEFLRQRLSYGETQDERELAWWEYSLVFPERIRGGMALSICEIATHVHVEVIEKPFIANRANPLIELPSSSGSDEHHLVAGLLNASTPLFWLKQVCFSKRESEEGATDTYFEFAGGKVQQLPIPSLIADALHGKRTTLADRLTALARECWDRGCALPSLALRKLFEKPNEAYHSWNTSLPGYVKPHKELRPFSSATELQQNFVTTREMREALRGEMIARQEEMDWLVYAAYDLVAGGDPPGACLTHATDLTLGRDQRPYRLLAEAAGDFEKALTLIPPHWSVAKKKLWRARLETIRDNENIRRIEQPVYKRRWDEQWKVGNRWIAGPIAYAQEFIDAFTWWLSEKAEWYLEHKAGDRPVALPDWSAAIFKDTRVAAAWPVVADATYQVEKYKWDALAEDKKETRRKPKSDDSYTAFERFLRDIVLEQSVAHGIPPAVPWDELAAKKKWTPAQLKKAQTVRGKLNVPRERFQQMSPTHFVQAAGLIG